MDYRYEISNVARDFHKKRRAFVIINKMLEFLPEGSSISHFEYCQAKGMSKEEFNKITRGFYLDGRVVFYKNNFIYDNALIEESLLYLDQISQMVLQSEFDIDFGQLPEKNFEPAYHYGKYKEGKVIKYE